MASIVAWCNRFTEAMTLSNCHCSSLAIAFFDEGAAELVRANGRPLHPGEVTERGRCGSGRDARTGGCRSADGGTFTQQLLQVVRRRREGTRLGGDAGRPGRRFDREGGRDDHDPLRGDAGSHQRLARAVVIDDDPGRSAEDERCPPGAHPVGDAVEPNFGLAGSADHGAERHPGGEQARRVAGGTQRGRVDAEVQQVRSRDEAGQACRSSGAAGVDVMMRRGGSRRHDHDIVAVGDELADQRKGSRRLGAGHRRVGRRDDDAPAHGRSSASAASIRSRTTGQVYSRRT